MRPVVLTFTRRYLPGYKAGGPIRTIAHLVEHLGRDFDFRIVTLDRDARDQLAFEGIAVDTWNSVGDAQVYYAREHSMRVSTVAHLLRETPHDVLYLNSFFDPKFTGLPLLARRFARAPKSPVVLAPRGEFSDGAMALKAWKKRPYVALTRCVGLFRDLTWQASSAFELSDIRRVMGAQASRVEIAPNLPARSPVPIPLLHQRAAGTPLRVLFASRITRKKNLDFALRVLAKVRSATRFSIVGPVEDERHWSECERLIEELPPHVSVDVRGGVEPEELLRIMAEHDLFILPTRGENYGHVIAEALSVGMPVLIADTTPWRGLQELGVGWDLPLASEAAFVDAIESAAALGETEHAAWRRRTVQYATSRLAVPAAVEANRRLFTAVLVEGNAGGS